MLKKTFRLTKKDYIPKLIAQGQTRSTQFFIAKSRKNTAENCRFSVIVSKKLFKKATARNHLRRQIYEAIRLNSSCKDQTQHFNSAILTRKSIIGKKYPEIEKNISFIIKHLHHKP